MSSSSLSIIATIIIFIIVIIIIIIIVVVIIPYMINFITYDLQVHIRSETATLEKIVSVTKDGIENTFEGIQVITSVKEDKLHFMLKNFGRDFKKALIYDRIKEELRIFCAASTIDEVYNTKFLEIVDSVKVCVLSNLWPPNFPTVYDM